jgi:Protein of unknown function (DUF2905)
MICRTAMNRLLIIIGLICISAGLSWPWLRRLPLFRLPGDFVIDRPGVRVFFPLTTMLVISALLSLLAILLRK